MNRGGTDEWWAETEMSVLNNPHLVTDRQAVIGAKVDVIGYP